MDGEKLNLSVLRVRQLINEYVRIHLGISRFKVISAENFGNHWRVKIAYRCDDVDGSPSKHLFAINQYGILIWEKAC